MHDSHAPVVTPHQESIALPAANRPVGDCDWSVLTRAIAPNTIATYLIEVRHGTAPDVEPATAEVWANGERVATALIAGDRFELLVDLRPAD